MTSKGRKAVGQRTTGAGDGRSGGLSRKEGGVNDKSRVIEGGSISGRIDDEVRRRYIDMLASAGIDSGRLSLESLFMLPTEFTRFYADLFHRALSGIDGVGGGQQGSREKGELGRRSGQGTAGAMGHRGKRVMIGGGSGKRWKNLPWNIRDEHALEVKERIDRELLKLVGVGKDDLRARGGDQPGEIYRGGSKCRGEKCGRFVKENWRFCAYCGSRQV